MSYAHNEQHPAPNSFHDSPHHHEGDSRPPPEYPQQGNPSQVGAPDDPLDGVGYNSKDAVRTPPGSPTNSRLPAQGYPQQAGNSKDAVRTPPSPDQVGNLVQGQTSPKNLHQQKPSPVIPSLDIARTAVQGQTSPRNLQQEKPSTDVPSLDTVIKHLEDPLGPIGGPVPGYPLSSVALSPSKKETSCIRKCLAAFSPCCG
ncbi:acidic proline-rich protein PRP25-like isoform X5 [Carya illinoinensis]|uniref:acidic proline-rich protein PRP25-like isoform X5 n=1 Tax=Carya illinoinensis TaxID=32201 RepID=UPI001C718CF9|nr:acidic proline-rich protein PRP25-like isoform X5 [Carya illinoinensis]